jgi:hypothetical protein
LRVYFSKVPPLSPTGRYVYLEATGVAPGTQFDLYSPNLLTFGEPPFMGTFWYHVYGSSPATLQVYGWDGQALTPQPLWTLPQQTFDGEIEDRTSEH